MYTDIDDQIDYANKMKDDLLQMQNIKIKLFKSFFLTNIVINGLVPHFLNQFEGKLEFIPSNNESLDAEIYLKPTCTLTEQEIRFMVDKIVYELLWQIKGSNYTVLTPDEWYYISSKYSLLYTINIFPELVIIRF